jgi:hypothetical protein
MTSRDTGGKQRGRAGRASGGHDRNIITPVGEE